MSKRLFAVVLTDEQREGAAKIQAAFDPSDLYHLDANTYVVAHAGLSRDVAQAAGIFKDLEGTPGETAGVVFKLNGSYTGFSRQSLWEWLEEAEKSARNA